MLTKQIEDPQVIIGRVRSHVDCELALRKGRDADEGRVTSGAIC
jgi:hypothetical protein